MFFVKHNRFHNKMIGLFLVVFFYLVFNAADVVAKWEPVEGKIMTRWAKEVNPDAPWPEYPRPMMVREQWQNLNGLWDYAIRPKDDKQPKQYDGKILVPYPIESALSGVKKTVGKENRLWYYRELKIPATWSGRRVLLHFDAVDWDVTVWVNGKAVGSHQGGYDPFSLDITDALKKSDSQELIVSVWDPTNEGTQPRGKQVTNPRGIWYTSVTGIWQTVWLESVPRTYIQSIHIVPDIDEDEVRITVNTKGNMQGCSVNADVKAPGFSGSASMSGSNELKVLMPNAKLWSPDSPHLYDLTVSIQRNGKVIDEVKSYIGMRKIEIKKDEAGMNRLFLNGQALFQYGPLDQGWWPDGLYTAPTDAALRYDIEVLKKLGCNMLRKHVKVEPRRLYYWCDKLGLLVWQDMPNGDRHIRGNQPDLQRSEESSKQFELEYKAVIDALINHPSIVMWVPFNEGWGQYDTPRIVKWTKEYDPTRLVNNASGWSDRGVGDVLDIHRYPGPGIPKLEEKRAGVLGEFGGLGLPIKGHTWQDEKNWGYRSYKTREELTEAYVNLLSKLRTLIPQGLAAAVYTQTTDVEIEVNGMMTYNRAMIKMDWEKAAAAARKLYLPPPIVKTVLPTSKVKAQTWRYTTTKPASDWYSTNYDDSKWKSGPGGFGTEGTPGAVVGTKWSGSDIWIRRTVELKDTKWSNPQLSIHHDEDAEVYINGQLAAKFKNYTSGYTMQPLNSNEYKALKSGRNVIAVHCRQTTGGQYIDVGLIDVVERD
jgi:glycosyl hydrolase family 2